MSWLIFEDENFRIEQVQECPIAGYLIIFTKASGSSSVELLPPATLAHVGTVFQKTYAAIQKVIAPERIYCGSFGEFLPQVHWHIFPRTAWIQQAFLDAHPTQTVPVNGPALFEWARQHYKLHPHLVAEQDLIATIKQLRACMRE